MNLSLPMPTNFTPPSMEEASIYGSEIGLPESECEKFWFFYDAKDWKVGKTKMARWKSALSGWRLRWNGEQSKSRLSPAVESIKNQKEYDRVMERLKEIPQLYDSHRDMSPAHRLEYSKLKARRDELRAILRIMV